MSEPEAVGLVLVSHSLRLAEGTADVIRGLAGYVEIATAGGKSGALGATPGDVLRAVEDMRSSNILVFTDIGSSILATGAALDVADPDLRGRVTVLNAPFVEGAVCAAPARPYTDNRNPRPSSIPLARRAGGFSMLGKLLYAHN